MNRRGRSIVLAISIPIVVFAAVGGFMSRATGAWSRLPLGIANRLGPLISPKLPW